MSKVIQIDQEKCIGCGMCAKDCPYHVNILAKVYRRSGGTETAVPADGNRQSGAGNRRL